MLEDKITSLHRCACGRLYQDYTHLADRCEKCRSKLMEEWDKQKEDDDA